MTVSRKLVAVFAADVEGYSRLMGADEVGTLKDARSLYRGEPFNPLKHCCCHLGGGRSFKADNLKSVSR